MIILFDNFNSIALAVKHRSLSWNHGHIYARMHVCIYYMLFFFFFVDNLIVTTMGGEFVP